MKKTVILYKNKMFIRINLTKDCELHIIWVWCLYVQIAKIQYKCVLFSVGVYTNKLIRNEGPDYENE